jgi:hypothetical protein
LRPPLPDAVTVTAAYHPLDLCALTDTLIADADGIYHPGLHNDRLVLGLKGTMSESESHVRYGRKRTERRVENGVVRERQRRAPRGEGGGAAREGRALLQGLIRCGRCGRRMQVGYSGKTLVPHYACVRGQQRYGAKRPGPLAAEEIEWCRRAGADLRAVFDAPTTNDRERKQLLRAILTDVIVTVDRESEQHHAQLQIVWEGGAATEHTVSLPRTGSHTRCTDQDTIALVRRLAEHYPDKQIAAILARQGRRTGAGNPFTAHRVAGLRAYHEIPA